MRKINVTKKVKVCKGTALIINLEEESLDRVPFTVRDTGYPEVALQDQLEVGYKVVSIVESHLEEVRYSMPLELFIDLCESHGCVDSDPTDTDTNGAE